MKVLGLSNTRGPGQGLTWRYFSFTLDVQVLQLLLLMLMMAPLRRQTFIATTARANDGSTETSDFITTTACANDGSTETSDVHNYYCLC